VSPPTARPEGGRYWDAVAGDWSAREVDRLWRRHSDAVNSALCARWLEDGPLDRVLKTDAFDEAVAAGLVPLLAARARVVVGVDIAAAALAGARRRYPELRASVADVRRLPFADATFDAVVSLSTLDHFRSRDDLAAGLVELARVLRPGGRLIVTLDNPVNPIVALRNALPFEPLRRLRLVPYYVGATCPPAPLRRLLGEVGFEVLETTAILHCPRVLGVAATRVVERRGERAGARLLRGLGAFERLAGWPTRYVTGHFTAVLARRRP
jgi:SAM-dependent methyltransferase